jgi:hypothetical protein
MEGTKKKKPIVTPDPSFQHLNVREVEDPKREE